MWSHQYFLGLLHITSLHVNFNRNTGCLRSMCHRTLIPSCTAPPHPGKRLKGKQTKSISEEQKLTDNDWGDLSSDLYCTWISLFTYIVMILITPSTWKKLEKAVLIIPEAPINKNSGCAISIAFSCKTNMNFTSRTTHLPDGCSYLHFTDGETEALKAKHVIWRGFASKFESEAAEQHDYCFKCWSLLCCHLLFPLLHF